MRGVSVGMGARSGREEEGEEERAAGRGRGRAGRWWWRSLSMFLFLPLSNLLRTFMLKPRMTPNRRDIRQLQTIPRILQPLVAVIV
ncbi:hypothetical protein M405DRAFT_56871 [Rhizopogon salebrosus TDB-379]|nr:hypothetical protein M405DRAFT_56871 [Rhizopogon salebrosus TDB-379]